MANQAAGINEYDNPTDASENFVKAKKILADVDIGTIAKTCKAITLFVNNLQPGVSCVYEKDNRYSAIQDVKKMFDVTAPGMGMLSSDQKTLFFTWRVTGQSHIWKIDGPKSFPTQLTSGSDAVTLKEVSPTKR